MKKIALLTVLPLLLFGFSACKKVEGDNKNLDDDNLSIEEFMSVNPGSHWEYKSNEGEHFIRVPKGTKQVVNDREWDYYESTEQSTMWVTPEYFAKNGDKLLMLLDLDGSQENYLEVIAYKENPVVGETFTNTHELKFGIMNIHALIESSIYQTNATFEYQGDMLEDVTIIKNKLKAKTGVMPYIDCGDAFLYFKEGIGILKMDIDLSIMSFYEREYEDELIDYHIAE